MAGERRIVSFVIDLKDRATQGFRRIAREGLGGLQASAATTSRRLRAATTSFLAFGKSVLVAGAAVVALTTALGALAVRGGKVINVQRAFIRVTGDLEGSVAALSAASEGLVSNYDLMVGFNNALTLGAVENVQQFEDLTRTAISLGRALGVDAAFALDSLTIGIGRQSRMILDNLGLIVRVEAANRDYAAAVGTTVGALTESQKSIAFRTAAMAAASRKVEELGGIELNAADNVTQLTVALQNARDELGKFLATSPKVGEFFALLAEGADTVARILSGDSAIVSAAKESIVAIDDLETLQQVYIAFLNLLPNASRSIDENNDVLKEWGGTAEDVTKLILFLDERIASLIETSKEAAELDPPVPFEPRVADSDLREVLFGDPLGVGKRTLRPFAVEVDPIVSALEPIEDFLDTSLTKWQEIGLAIQDTLGPTMQLSDMIGGSLVNGMQSFTQSFITGIAQWRSGTKTLGEALQGAFLGALANVAAGFAQFYTAQAVAALAQGLAGDPRGFAAAAKYTAAALGMGVLAGALASGGGGGGGGLTTTAGGLGFENRLAGSVGTGGTVVVQGGILDLSDPRQADAFAKAIEEVSGLRLTFRGI